MLLSEIYQPIQKELNEFETKFREKISSLNGSAAYLSDTVLHFRGKRLRPALVLFCAKMNDKKIDDAVLSLAVAMELIHTASLIHDDVIDVAKLRRKSPTINAQGDNQLAVLMGDYLYSQSSVLLSKIDNQKILLNLSQTTKAMCQSEILQFTRRGDLNLKEEEYLGIIKNKTASLIASCCSNAAILAKAKKRRLQALTAYGLNFGMAFQIVDDCLDFIGQEKTLGKTLGLDLKRGSLTLPLIYLLNSSQRKSAQRLLKNVFFPEEQIKDLDKIKDLVLQSTSIDKSYQKAREYVNGAQQSLKIFDKSAEKTALIKLSELCLSRSN